MKAAHATKLASRRGLSPTVSSNPPESRTRQSDWARIRQEHNVMDTSSFLEQAQIPSQLRPDPSLRINNGPLPLGAGEGVNREMRVPSNEGIFPPSSGVSVYVERESRGARWEKDLPEVGLSPYVVPERFRAGRESSSVIRNVTNIRDSKRPKARAQDHDYQRRSSISSSLRRMPVVGNGFEISTREAPTYHSRWGGARRKCR